METVGRTGMAHNGAQDPVDESESDLTHAQPPDDSYEDDLQPTTFSFILKVWLEEKWVETGTGVWRGRITHVPSNAQRSIKSMDEVVAFIRSYLEPPFDDRKVAGVGVAGRLKRLLRRWLC